MGLLELIENREHDSNTILAIIPAILRVMKKTIKCSNENKFFMI